MFLNEIRLTSVSNIRANSLTARQKAVATFEHTSQSSNQLES